MFCRLQTRSFKLTSFLLNTALHNYYNTIKSTKIIFRRVTCKLGDFIDSSSTFNTLVSTLSNANSAIYQA